MGRKGRLGEGGGGEKGGGGGGQAGRGSRCMGLSKIRCSPEWKMKQKF